MVVPELVCDICPFQTLGEAAADVQPGEVRHFDVLAGTYVEPLGVHVLEGRSVTFVAAGGVTVTRTLPIAGPVFSVTGTADTAAILELDGLSIASIGARTVEATWGDVTLTDCVFSTIGIVDEGGAVFADHSILRVEGSLFLESFATTQGGHLLARDTTLTVIDTEFRGGFARYGGSLSLQSLDLVVDPVIVIGGRFADNLAAEAGGAIAVRGGVDLTVDGTIFEHNAAPVGGAVSDAVAGVGQPLPPLVGITAATFEDNVAEESGGAIATTLGSTSVLGSTFRANSAGTGGAIYVGGGALALTGSVLCGNDAERGGAVHTVTALPQAWTNLRFVENAADTDGGAILHEGAGALVLEHVNALGNRAPIGAGLLTSAQIELRSSLLAFSGPARAVDTTGPSATVALAGNAWWQNSGGDVEGRPDVLGGSEVQDQDPLLVRYVPGLGCDAVNDYYSWYGPLRDKAADGLDIDGSPADIGAYGGPSADAAPWQDADGDGFPALYDCLEGDPAFHPDDGAGDVEVWYDDLDQDCRGDDDHDQDADGWRPPEDCDDTDDRVNPGARDLEELDLDCEPGIDGDGDGSPPPGDCDDEDPDVHPGALEDPDPTVDRDCDGTGDVVRGLVPAPCSTGPVPAAGLPIVLALLGVRNRTGAVPKGRRRPSADPPGMFTRRRPG